MRSGRCRSRPGPAAPPARPAPPCPAGAPDRAHDVALAQLQRQPLGREPRLGQDLGHLLHQAGAGELARRQVDRHRDRVRSLAGLVPAAGSLAGAAQTLRPIGTISPISSAYGDEPGGRHDAAPARVPAGERLHRHDAAVVQVDDGLEGERDLVALERALQVERELVAAANAGVHLGGVLAEVVLARRLGRVHGQVGVAEQLVGAGGRGGERDADARLQAGLAAGQVERALHRLQQRPGHRLGPHLVGGLEQDGELVPAQPAGGVALRMALDAAATRRSTSSPTAWPRWSLTILKSSRSRNSTAPRSRRVRAIADSTRSRRSARLGRPVSGSWKAWWRSKTP